MKNLVNQASLMAKVLPLAFIITLCNCTTKPPANSGFMSDYSKLHEDRYGDKSLKWWEKDGFDWGTVPQDHA